MGEDCRGREACDKMTSDLTGNMDLDALNGGAGMELDDRTGQPEARMTSGLAALEANLVAMLQSLSYGNAAAGSSDNVVMDDISVRSNPLVKRMRQLCKERPADVAAAWRAILALILTTYNPPQGRTGVQGAPQPLTRLAQGRLVDFGEAGKSP